ncbi:MAG: dTDP-4-dehydrorhamnose 3,5-epimerase [Pseudohongiellaceae bacterium]
MNFTKTEIPEVIIIEPKVHGDHRGFFMETFRQQEFEQAGISSNFVQDNHSKSTQGILRGLHYQIQNPQGKLVRVVVGEVYDVAVDLRRSSPTFGQWVGVVLSAGNKRALWVPPGFAHGFYVMSPFAEVTYKCTSYYEPEFDRSLLWSDQELNISWPDKVNVVLSDKDRIAPSFALADKFS